MKARRHPLSHSGDAGLQRRYAQVTSLRINGDRSMGTTCLLSPRFIPYTGSQHPEVRPRKDCRASVRLWRINTKGVPPDGEHLRIYVKEPLK